MPWRSLQGNSSAGLQEIFQEILSLGSLQEILQVTFKVENSWAPPNFQENFQVILQLASKEFCRKFFSKLPRDFPEVYG